jgi:thymidine kinase
MKQNKLNIIIGCMFSGKTSELVRECSRRLHNKQKVIAINYIDDNRYTEEDYIVSHNLEKIKCIKVKYLKEVPIEEIDKIDFIFIDEGQFFTDLKEYVTKWCDEYKKNITIVGLDGDFKREPFGQILDLIPKCDNIIKLKALCALCNDDTEGLFTCRLSSESEQVSIGVDNYMPLCRYHYLEKTKI